MSGVGNTTRLWPWLEPAPQNGPPHSGPQKVAGKETLVEPSYFPCPITSRRRSSEETIGIWRGRLLWNLMTETVTSCILYGQLFAGAQRRFIWNNIHASLPERSISLPLFCLLQKNLEHTDTTSNISAAQWPSAAHYTIQLKSLLIFLSVTLALCVTSLCLSVLICKRRIMVPTP